MFIKRLFLFLIGVLLGTLMVYFTLIRGRDRDLMGWLPAKRVINEIKAKHIVAKSNTTCYLECYSVKEKNIEEFLEDADVSFARSEPREEPPVYVIINEVERKKVLISFEMAADTAYIIKVESEPTIACDC